ncbi:MAG: GH25 family lysozyme [Anaerolineae bacterium]
MEWVPGVDVSRWQGEIDWEKVAAADYRFAVIRATIGDQYTDPRFYHNWHGARDAGLLVSAYHVITPNAPADTQIDHFFEVLDDRQPDLPFVVDVERDDGAAPERITACVRDVLSTVEGRHGRSPIVYTARWFWNRFVLASDEWQNYDLWVASYTAKPVLPRDWKSWRFWQYSESGKVPGVTSRSTDVNWFAGRQEDLVDYANDKPRAVPRPLWRARVVIPKLNVRSGPSRDHVDLGDLYEGDQVEVLKLRGDDVWVEFAPGKWAAFALDGEQYMEVEPEERDEQAPSQDQTSEST